MASLTVDDLDEQRHDGGRQEVLKFISSLIVYRRQRNDERKGGSDGKSARDEGRKVRGQG